MGVSAVHQAVFRANQAKPRLALIYCKQRRSTGLRSPPRLRNRSFRAIMRPHRRWKHARTPAGCRPGDAHPIVRVGPELRSLATPIRARRMARRWVQNSPAQTTQLNWGYQGLQVEQVPAHLQREDRRGQQQRNPNAGSCPRFRIGAAKSAVTVSTAPCWSTDARPELPNLGMHRRVQIVPVATFSAGV